MKILILGGDGFIGSHLRTSHILKGDDVLSIDKENLRSRSQGKPYTFKQYDVFDNERMVKDIEEFKPDFAYNCIAVANPGFYVLNPLETFNIDFQLNYQIIQCLYDHSIPFIHFSTSEVYGKKQEGESYNEQTSNLIMGPSHKLRWIYATSKILLEQLIIANNLKGKHSVIVRPFNFIGYDIDWFPSYHGQKEWVPRVYSCFMDELIIERNLTVVLPGTQKRCYTYIDDAIEALHSIVNHWDVCTGKIFNIGNPKNEIEISNLAKLMISIYKSIVPTKFPYGINTVDGNIFYGKGYDDSERRVPDISEIHKCTGWKPKTGMEEMLCLSMVKTIKLFRVKE